MFLNITFILNIFFNLENINQIVNIDNGYHCSDSIINTNDKLLIKHNIQKSSFNNEFSLLIKKYQIVDIIEGDLNFDLLIDYIFVMQFDENTNRFLTIYFRTKKGTFDLTGFSDDLILCSRCGGVCCGDPYNGIKVKKGRIILTENGGSSEKWESQKYYFYKKTSKNFIHQKTISKSYNSNIKNSLKIVPEKIKDKMLLLKYKTLKMKEDQY